MITPVDQRVRHRRTFFVDPSRRFDPRGFEVAPIADDETPRAFIAEHHYAKSYVPALRRFGLYAPGGQLVGVAVFSVPTNDLALLPLPGSPRESCDLTRWLHTALKKVGRRRRHHGNHKYVFPLCRAARREVRRAVGDTRPYPRFQPELLARLA